MNDPTGFYTIFGVAFVTWIGVLCVWFSALELRRLVRRRHCRGSLRTPKPVQDWLRWWMEEGRYR